MSKKFLLILAGIMALSSVAYAVPGNLEEIDPNELSKSQKYQLEQQKNPAPVVKQDSKKDSQENANNVTSKVNLEQNVKFYPNANIKSGIAKYKNRNYTGCIQELYALTKKDPSNALAYYYMAMAYTKLGSTSDAISSYDRVIALASNKFLIDYATKGRDCLTGGPACAPPAPPKQEAKEELTDLDKFINAPYGNGLSPELNVEIKQKQLENIQQTINNKEELEKRDIERIRKFDDKNKSKIETNDKIASASVSDEDILNAIKTLKDAGVTVNVQPTGMDATSQMFAQNPQMAEMSLLMGGNNNNNNSMMNMIPFMMAQSQNGKNIDPRVMQAVIMNSMMPDFNYNDSNNR